MPQVSTMTKTKINDDMHSVEPAICDYNTNITLHIYNSVKIIQINLWCMYKNKNIFRNIESRWTVQIPLLVYRIKWTDYNLTVYETNSSEACSLCQVVWRDLLSVLQCETETYASYSRHEHENMFYYITYCLYRGITALP